VLKRFIWAISVALLSVFLCSIAVYASWVLKFPTNITDTSGSTRTYLPVMLGYGGQTLVDMGKISSNGTNTNMQIGTSNIKYMMATGNVTCVIPNLPATGIVTSDLYTGYSPEQTAFAIITGSGGYVTVTDAPAMEFGGNFSYSISGYFDTSVSAVGSHLLYKNGAFDTYVPSAGNITSVLIGGGVATNLIIYPAGDDTIGIAGVFGSATHWDAVNDPAGAPDDAATYVDSGIAAWRYDYYTTTYTGNIPTNSVINSVIVTYRAYNGGGVGVGQGGGGVRLGGINTLDTRVLPGAWTTYTSAALARPGGGSWTVTDILSLQIVAGLLSDAISTSFETQVYITVNYTPPLLVSLAATSGTHTITGSGSGVTNLFSLSVDASTDSVALGAATVVNNANNYVVLQSNAVPYADNMTITIGGTQQMWLAPNVMISGTTIPDRSGNAHTGAITWGSNSNISLSYGAMESYVDYIASINATGGYDFPPASLPSTWFASGGNVTALPFYDAFSSVSLQTGQPVQMLYGLGIIGLAFGAFLLLVIFTRSALIGYIAMVMVFGIGASMSVIPMWIVFTLILVGAGIMYLYRQVAY